MHEVSIEGFRISPQQKHLWMLQPSKFSQPFRANVAILVEGNIKTEVLKIAVQDTISKHEILRTNFRILEGMIIPLQVISEKNVLTIVDYDFTGLSRENQNAKIESLFQDFSQEIFDFEYDSLLNISLLALAPEKYIMLVRLPAMIADSASIQNFLGEICRTYEACVNNQNLLGQPLQYADFAGWQNELFEGEDAELGQEYWSQKQNILAFTDWQLPGEHQTAKELEFKPEFVTINFDADILNKLIAIAQDYHTCVATILQACWQILLWRLTGGSNITIGTLCQSRKYEELASALGLFAQYLPVNSALEATSKFSKILKQTDAAIAEVFQWQESFNWEQVTDESNQLVSFFPLCFEFLEQPAKYSTSDISFSIYKQYICIDRFKVKLSCMQWDESLTAELHYDTNLFLVEDIHRWARYFQILLMNVANNPEAAIGEFEILSKSDLQQLLTEFNNTQINYPPQQCIHHLFEQQVARTPEHIAVVFEQQQLTYTQLNTRANKLAHHLQTLGVGPETIVALCVERSLDMLVGLWAILKAGGVYLPLDPLLPRERITFMLQDAGAAVILTQQHLTEQFSQQPLPVFCLDTHWDVISKQQDTNPLNQATPENLIYVIYTSGSTGQPKGVAIEHRQLFNYLYGILAKLDLPIASSFATVSTFAADLGNTAIFPALCTGGCLHLISQERATNPEAFADYCDRYSIDCLKIVPSHLNALLSASQPHKILPRQRLILGGEALSWNLIEKLQQYQPKCEIFNHYGPTETTVGVATYKITGEAISNKSETVPLGRPIANTQVYILDHDLRPVPIGVAGELYIGGNNLARGYLKQSDNNFIPNCFSDASGSKLYKTGDLARYLPDGNIEFLGRIDQQVKIHGFRIEISEIETALGQYPAIRETVVLTREDKPGNKRLVAYIVPQPHSEVSTSELRHFLKQKLPEYMIPAAFVRLKALPLTPNGKVNRLALPEPDSIKPELEGKFVAPRTVVEEKIAKIWSQVLEVEQVGIYDNFFELGGDSIISMQIIARLNQAGLQLTPKQVFEYPTVAGLAAVASTDGIISAQQEVVTGTLPLTPIQHWFFEQKLQDPHHWNQSLLLEVPPTIEPDILRQALQHLLEYHDALRLRFTPQTSSWQQVNTGLDEVQAVPFSYTDLSESPASVQKTIQEATAAQLQTSLNLETGPLMRVALFKLSENQPQRLLWVIHHLAVDGVSWRILLADIQQVYQQLSQGETPKLSLKTTAFKQWSEFLQEYAQSASLQKERDYWLQSSRQSSFSLPVDHPSGANTVVLGHTVSISLSATETSALLQEVPAAYQTEINDVLLTALVQTFAQWTKQPSLLVDLEGHGREAIANNIDLSRTVGWFTTIFPVLLTLEGISHPGEALKAVKEQLRNVPNRGIGYGVLRYLCQDATIITQMQTFPPAQVRFNYLGQFDQVMSASSFFKLISQNSGTNRSARAQRPYLLDINGFVLEGKLQLEWTYSEEIYQKATIEQLAQGWVKALRSLINHCQSAEAGGYTPSDFAKAKLNQKDLDQLLAKINRSNDQTSK
ncbi:amino acid adenylation domain-containing protein [Nostoc sp.]|uniref:amino acid adenylation domain-containing protein n=1 Tax=Nostoc sp. TaxID=1180 RepID=UPI002FF4D451